MNKPKRFLTATMVTIGTVQQNDQTQLKYLQKNTSQEHGFVGKLKHLEAKVETGPACL